MARWKTLSSNQKLKTSTRKKCSWALPAVLMVWCFLISESAVARCLLATQALLDREHEAILDLVPSDRDGRPLHEILASAERVEVFNISGAIQYEFPIIKANTILFRPYGTLQWIDVDAPLWLMVAETVHFQGAATITRAPFSVETPPTPRSPDAHGDPSYIRNWDYSGDLSSESNRQRNPNSRGREGGPGGAGEDGMPGSTLDLPCLVVIAKNLIFDPFAFLQIDLIGIDGGDGGEGGRGGSGGYGESGANARSKYLSCKREPQDGGAGGPGGPGGRGGNAGDGGRGADIIYIGLRNVVKLPPARRSGSVAGVTGACVCDGSGVKWPRVG